MDTVLRVSTYTGITGTPNRTLTGQYQPRPKGETRRVVRLDVPFRVAISQPQLNTDGYGSTRIKHRSHWDTESDPYRESPVKTVGRVQNSGPDARHRAIPEPEEIGSKIQNSGPDARHRAIPEPEEIVSK